MTARKRRDERSSSWPSGRSRGASIGNGAAKTFMPSAFLDSNIILYAALPPARHPQKSAVALDLLKTTDFGVSGQTLAEVYNVLSRQPSSVIGLAEIELWILSLAERPLAPVDATIVRNGIALSRRHKINYFDAALIAAAEVLGAETFFSEDLNDGQVVGSVKIMNPFPAETR